MADTSVPSENGELVDDSKETLGTSKKHLDFLKKINFDKHLAVFADKAQQMREKAHNNSHYPLAIEKTEALCSSLHKAKADFLNNTNRDIEELQEDFIDTCIAHIAEAKIFLAQHREWLGAFTKFLADLIAWFSPVLASQLGFFGKTDSTIKLEQFENVLFPSDDAINYVSLDADGCVFNRKYHNHYFEEIAKRISDAKIDINPCYYPIGEFKLLPDDVELKVVSDTNPLLFDFFIRIKPDVLYCGSNRQAPQFDKLLACQNKTARFLQLLPLLTPLIAEKTKHPLILDKFLLCDLTRKSKPGSHFDDDESREKLAFDTHKFMILYPQIHRAATLHPERKINFYLIDDRDDILNELAQFTSAHPDLLPNNVVLHLMKYTGEKRPKRVHLPISGTGLIDYQHAENILMLCGLFYREETILYKINGDSTTEVYNEAAKKVPDAQYYIDNIQKRDGYEADCMLPNLLGCPYGIRALKQFKAYLKLNRNAPSDSEHRARM